MRATVAIEAPGASGDAGVYSDRVELQNIRPRFPMPDITGNLRLARARRATSRSAASLRNQLRRHAARITFELSGTSRVGRQLQLERQLSKKDVLRLQYV